MREMYCNFDTLHTMSKLKHNSDRIASVLNSPVSSPWLKFSLREAVLRDPVDAANDVEALRRLLSAPPSDQPERLHHPDVPKVMDCPSTSRWLKASLRMALLHDPVDARRHVALLANLLHERAQALLETAAIPVPRRPMIPVAPPSATMYY